MIARRVTSQMLHCEREKDAAFESSSSGSSSIDAEKTSTQRNYSRPCCLSPPTSHCRLIVNRYRPRPHLAAAHHTTYFGLLLRPVFLSSLPQHCTLPTHLHIHHHSHPLIAHTLILLCMRALPIL